MITLSRWREMGKFFARSFPLSGRFIYGAADEDILAKVEKLGPGDYPVLVGILPTLNGTGYNFDSWGHTSPIFYYCLVPLKNSSDDEIDEAWELTLNYVAAIEEAVNKNRDSAEWPEFYDIKVDTFHIDPEYNVWGCMGWSLGFEMTHVDPPSKH